MRDPSERHEIECSRCGCDLTRADAGDPALHEASEAPLCRECWQAACAALDAAAAFDAYLARESAALGCTPDELCRALALAS